MGYSFAAQYSLRLPGARHHIATTAYAIRVGREPPALVRSVGQIIWDCKQSMLPIVAVAAGAYVIWKLADDDQDETSIPKKVKRRRKRKKKPKVIESPPSAPLELPSAPQVPASAVPAPSDVPPVPSLAVELPAPEIEPSDSAAPQSQTEN